MNGRTSTMFWSSLCDLIAQASPPAGSGGVSPRESIPRSQAQWRAAPFMKHQAGFTLVEVMVAIVILAIALTGLTQGLTTALSSSKESELQTTAALFAAGQIELLRAEKDLADGDDQGDCGTALPLYRWRQTVSPTDVAGLHEVDVVVKNAQTKTSIYEL